MENYPAVNIFCELWPFGTYDPDTRGLYLDSVLQNVHLPYLGIFLRKNNTNISHRYVSVFP